MDYAQVGPHGARLELLQDARNPDNRLYRLESAGGNVVNLTGLEVRGIQTARRELDEQISEGGGS